MNTFCLAIPIPCQKAGSCALPGLKIQAVGMTFISKQSWPIFSSKLNVILWGLTVSRCFAIRDLSFLITFELLNFSWAVS